MNAATLNNINTWLMKMWKHFSQFSRSPSGFGDTMERYFRFFTGTPEKLAAVIEGLKKRIALNNQVVVNSSAIEERASHSYASIVMAELCRRLQGEHPNYRALPA